MMVIKIGARRLRRISQAQELLATTPEADQQRNCRVSALHTLKACVKKFGCARPHKLHEASLKSSALKQQSNILRQPLYPAAIAVVKTEATLRVVDVIAG